MFTRCQKHKKLQNNAKTLQCQPASVPGGYLLHHCCQQIHIVDPDKIKERQFQKLSVRGRQTDEQTCVQTDRQTDNQTQVHGHTGRQMDNQTDRYTDRQMDNQTDRYTGRQMDNQTDRYTGRQIDFDLLSYLCDLNKQQKGI